MYHENHLPVNRSRGTHDSVRICRDAEAFGQSRDGPDRPVGLNLLGVKRCASRFQEIPVAAQTHELSLATAIGMAVGAEISEANPAVIRTGGMRAESDLCRP
jgi:hypothetical protein